MRSTPRIWQWRAASLTLIVVAGCSAGGSPEPLDVGGTSGATSTGGTGSGGLIGIGGQGGAGSGTNLQAHIEKDSVRVEVITVGCAGTCADVVAIAKNGEPPYTFEWEDGTTAPNRRLCPSANADYSVTVTDKGVQRGELRRPPQTAHALVTANVFDCSPIDAGAGVPDAGPPPACESGDTVKGDPVGGTTTYFRQGVQVPAGRYRISYLDGCMSYGLNWTIHNIVAQGWYIAGTLTALPGISGAGYVNFEDCVAANRPVPPIEIDHPGGSLGIWNNDYPLTDNRNGVDGRDPTWCLTPL